MTEKALLTFAIAWLERKRLEYLRRAPMDVLKAVDDLIVALTRWRQTL